MMLKAPSAGSRFFKIPQSMALLPFFQYMTEPIQQLSGSILLEGVTLEDKYILTSGRIPMDMIQKVTAIGVPMIVSRSTPTIAAVETARKTGITLLGFSRENRFNIYSASHRLKGCSLPVEV